MKWPFVTRSKYESVLNEKNEQSSYKDWWEKKANDLTQSKASCLVELNRLNQELASELNSHRETRETKNKVIESNLNQIRGLEKDFEREFNLHKETKKELEETKDAFKIAQEDLKETKDHEQKLFEAHDKLNQQNMGLLFENEKLLKQINQLRFDKSHLKNKVKKLESKLVYFEAEYTIMKKNADWFYGNYCRFKDMIEKSGYFPGK